MRIKRYSFLLIIIMAVLLTGCSTGNTETIDTEKDITMFVATDIHYLSKDLYDSGSAFQDYMDASDGKLINYIDEIMLAFTKDISEKKPDILIISGDLTNNGEKESHIKLSERLADIEQETGTRIYVIPGNHDISNPWARGFQETEQYITDAIDVDDFEKIYDGFGYEEAISRDKSSLSYLAAPSDDLWLLMLDTSIYDFNELMGSPTTNGEIDSDTLEWIRECSQLAKDEHAQILTIMHHNLINHSEVLNSGFTLDNDEEVRKVFRQCGIELVLSGHIHIQDIKSAGKGSKLIHDITTSALSVYPIQYGVLKFNPAQGFDYSTSLVDVQDWAKDSGSSDENLINFDEYVKDYFADISYKKAYNTLTEVGTYSEHDKELMAETMSLLNNNYFGGTINAIAQEVLESEGYQLWLEAKEPEFLKNYIVSMIKDSNRNSTNVKIAVTD